MSLPAIFIKTVRFFLRISNEIFLNSWNILDSTADETEKKQESVPNRSIDSSLLLKIRGLPWTATKKDLRDFFVGIKILNDLDGIHFISDDQNNFGVAYIQLATKKDYELAQGYHKKKMDGRYIEGAYSIFFINIMEFVISLIYIWI